MIKANMLVKLREKLRTLWMAKRDEIDKAEVDSQYIQPIQHLSATEEGGDNPSNKALKRKQYNLLLIILGAGIIGLLIVVNILQGKIKHKSLAKDNGSDKSKPKLELASEALDPDKMWRNHFEDLLNQNKRKFEERLSSSEAQFSSVNQQLQEETKREMTKMQAQLDFAKNELLEATEELKRMRQAEATEEGRKGRSSFDSEQNISSLDLNSSIEFDRPKDARTYIPETSYVSGYLLGGLAVSTALSAPDENATPVVIRLTGRGNLPKNFRLDIATCRILGSSYGDLSSERAIIRLEKMVCADPVTELVTTSNIAGTVYGPDGMNGIKGKVVATSSKHIKNAIVGGVISGFSQSGKGQDSVSITGLGTLTANKKGFKEMATSGALSGASNAAEKVADYYLRQAESMSPVLTIPGGVKVDVLFMKGFFVGELTAHKKIAQERKQQNLDNRKFGAE